MFFKSCVGFVLSNCLDAKKNTFGKRITPYSIALSVHKQPSVYNTTYMIQSRVNCPCVLQSMVSKPNITKSFILNGFTIKKISHPT